jgi:hypothetical protein
MRNLVGIGSSREGIYLQWPCRPDHDIFYPNSYHDFLSNVGNIKNHINIFYAEAEVAEHREMARRSRCRLYPAFGYGRF